MNVENMEKLATYIELHWQDFNQNNPRCCILGMLLDFAKEILNQEFDNSRFATAKYVLGLTHEETCNLWHCNGADWPIVAKISYFQASLEGNVETRKYERAKAAAMAIRIMVREHESKELLRV